MKSREIYLLKNWAEINTYTYNPQGIESFNRQLKKAFYGWVPKVTEIPLQPVKRIDQEGNIQALRLGKALHVSVRPKAPFRIFFGGHSDTVYPNKTAVQHTKDKLIGPGVADMKGGLMVMIKALETFEKSPLAKNIGWELFINPDEEIGSPSSVSIYTPIAKTCDIALLFEPSFADGSFVSARKGSANFTITAQGEAAHAGRDFFEGKSAIFALSHAVANFHQLSDKKTGTTLNVGLIHGGTTTNVVPAFAMARLNIRYGNRRHLSVLIKEIRRILKTSEASFGVQMTLHPEIIKPPKPFDRKTKKLFDEVKECAMSLSLPFKTVESGGTCDGNHLAALGLAAIDSLGVIGGHLHSPKEYMMISSLHERIELTLNYLLKKGVELC